MQQCRSGTLRLFESVDDATFRRQAHPDFSPIGWHLGHIAYTEALWLLEHGAGLPTQFPHYRRLFAADGLPKHDRVYLPVLEEVQQYLNSVRDRVFDYLEQAPIEAQERLWRWLLQHESQHGETIAIVLALQNHYPTIAPEPSPSHPVTNEMVRIPAGEFLCGSDAIDALDNERPTHPVWLDTYWIDRTPVTCEQYQIFMESGGYQDSRWWSAEGWQWLQTAGVTQPLYWREAWKQHPVCGVSGYEAEAYARFVGKQLPTEAEWEKAALWNPNSLSHANSPDRAEAILECGNHNYLVGRTTPVGYYPASASGCYDLLGNVWEWTETWFRPYPGFQAYPYRGYSQAYFDDRHRVLRGGSWATCAWALRPTFRNWYHPHVREIFAGFRCVRRES